MAFGKNTAVLLAVSAQAYTTGGNSADLTVDQYDELALDINVTAVGGTGSPTLTVFVDRKGAEGTYNQIYASSAITANGLTSTSIGPGLANNVSIGNIVRLRWTITGTTPSFTMSQSILAK